MIRNLAQLLFANEPLNLFKDREKFPDKLGIARLEDFALLLVEQEPTRPKLRKTIVLSIRKRETLDGCTRLQSPSFYRLHTPSRMREMLELV
jgi:hypothetical protein